MEHGVTTASSYNSENDTFQNIQERDKRTIEASRMYTKQWTVTSKTTLRDT